MTEIVGPELGFVVIGRNEGSRLEKCLRSVLRLSRQVVYSDSASTDGSAQLAERLGAAVVILPSDGRLTAARGRNSGYQELCTRFPQCQFVQFLDGDCILQNGWIEEALSFLRARPDVAVACGRRFEAHPEASLFNALCDREWDTPVGEAQECGGDALVRCEAFDEVGGYRAQLKAGEEPEMTARMRAAGWTIWRIDAQMAEHDAKIYTLLQWWRRTQRGGYGYAQVWSTTRELPRRLYARQLASALAWAVVLPIAVCVFALINKQAFLLLALPLLYGAQMLRIAGHSGNGRRWTNAALILFAKFPEAFGACRYFLAGEADRLSEYKI